MSSFDAVAGLSLTVEGFRTERREAAVSSEFTRVTTTVLLEGDGRTGEGEDVTYGAAEHDDFPALLAEALDAIAACDDDVKIAAERLGCTSSQLIKLLKDEPQAIAALNVRRKAAGLHELK